MSISVAVPETCFTQKRRVFFALDSSPGRGRKKFKDVKEFMHNLVSKLQIGLSNSQVGFLQYDDPTTTRDHVVFNKDDSFEKILWRIQNAKYRKGKESYLGNALKIVNDEVTFARKVKVLISIIIQRYTSILNSLINFPT